MKKRSLESIEKEKATRSKNQDKNEKEKIRLINEIQIKAHEDLMPNMKKKMLEVSKYIEEKISNNKEELNSSQIMTLIAKRSLSEIASGTTVTYTPQEISVGFNYYLDMINKINDIKKFPPTIESFCVFMGITVATYNNWLVNAEKKEIMDYIHSYLMGAINTSTLNREVDTIAGIYTTKTMGKIEKQAPVVVEHKKSANFDDISKQLEALKKDNIIDAEWEEENE